MYVIKPVIYMLIQAFGRVLLQALPAVITVVGSLWYILKEYRLFRKRQLKEKAAKLYSAIYKYIEYIEQIKNSTSLYEHDGYYPSEYPEKYNQDSKSHPERPSRLIINYTFDLREQIFEDLGSMVEYIDVSLFKDMMKQASALAGFLHAQRDDNNYTEDIRKSCIGKDQEYFKKLKDKSYKMLQSLEPLIK